jgi:hypothetical protein
MKVTTVFTMKHMKELKKKLHGLHALHGDLSCFVVPQWHDLLLQSVMSKK